MASGQADGVDRLYSSKGRRDDWKIGVNDFIMEIACNRQWVNCIANLCPWRQALNFPHCLHRLLMVRGCGNHPYYSLRNGGRGMGRREGNDLKPMADDPEIQSSEW